MSTRIEQWVRPEIRALQAYPVPDHGDMVKLDAMENPYGWEEEAFRDEWLAALAPLALNRYPDAGAGDVKALLRATMEVPEDQAIVLGNGSDELIQMLALLLAGPDRSILAPEPGFVMYRMIARFANLGYHGVPLRAGDFDLDLEAMLAAIAKHRPALVFLAYPNNPTGNLFPRAAVEAIIQAAPGLVVVDEAYCAFADDSFMADLGKYDHLLVMRTVSKIGLAGIRLGMLAGPPAWINELEKIRLPYNINTLTQASAKYALGHYERLLEQTDRIRAERESLSHALSELPDCQVWPSQANFLLTRFTDGPATFHDLKEHGILIKNLHGAHPLLENCLRFTVGTPSENDALLKALRARR